MIEQRPDLRSRPSDLFSRWGEAHGLIGPLAVGKYVQTEDGWGRIEYVGHGSVVISLFALREDPGPQHAPEIDAEIAWRESGANDEPLFERYEMSLVKSRSYIAPAGAESWIGGVDNPPSA